MRIATWNINSVRLRIQNVLRFVRFLHDATYKAKVLADRNKSILRDYDNQIDLNFGLMKLCVGEFECELARNNQ